METSELWLRTLAAGTDTLGTQQHKERLRTALRLFRQNAEVLASEIPRDVPGLTDHSVKHFDALWDIASLLTSNEVSFNPLEAFVFGGAVLLHDLANGMAAFPNGLADLHGPEWNDIVHSIYRQRLRRAPSDAELKQPDPSVLPDIVLERLRAVHAAQAEHLATQGFRKPAARGADSGERIYLIPDEELREQLGGEIGRIAHSHHWSIERVEQEFVGAPFPSPSPFPSDWTIDRLKIALLLRTADAAQIDSRRAPTLLFALRRPVGASLEHWNFQNHLTRPVVENEQLIYRTSRPFTANEVDSWWLCFDVLNMIHRELAQTNEALLRSHRKPFSARGVRDHDSVARLSVLIKADGWVPVDARIAISNVTSVVRRFGGAQLYGDDPLVPLRELISNAADAIRARRALEQRAANWGSIHVRIGKDDDQHWIEVEDNGVGMSTAVLTDSLLEFGTSYWDSALARQEHPGLYSGGFKPTGEFGIGFFSAFMLGDKVQVVSQPLPKSGIGSPPCHVLEFPHGTESRPLLRVAGDKEMLREPGTRVRVWLKGSPGLVEDGIGDLVASMLSREDSPEWRGSRALVRTVARIAPCLDVDVFTSAYGEPAQQVIAANDWSTVPFADLLKRIGHRGANAESTQSRVFSVAGRPVARLGLPLDGRGETTIVVGGFSTSSGISGFPGVILGVGPDLARHTAEPRALDLHELGTWLGEIEADLASGVALKSRAIWYATAFLEAGVRPRKIKCFHRDVNWMSTEDLEGAELPDEVAIVLPMEFSWGRDAVPFNTALENCRLILQPDVIVAPATQAGFIKPQHGNLPVWGREYLHDFVECDGKPFPWTLALLAAEAVSRNWKQPLDSLLQPLRRHGTSLDVEFNRKIGTYANDAATATALVLRKNATPTAAAAGA